MLQTESCEDPVDEIEDVAEPLDDSVDEEIEDVAEPLDDPVVKEIEDFAEPLDDSMDEEIKSVDVDVYIPIILHTIISCNIIILHKGFIISIQASLENVANLDLCFFCVFGQYQFRP